MSVSSDALDGLLLSNHDIRELINVSKDFMQHFEGTLQEHGDGSTQCILD